MLRHGIGLLIESGEDIFKVEASRQYLSTVLLEILISIKKIFYGVIRFSA
jgi:hypothetical protein